MGIHFIDYLLLITGISPHYRILRFMPEIGPCIFRLHIGRSWISRIGFEYQKKGWRLVCLNILWPAKEEFFQRHGKSSISGAFRKRMGWIWINYQKNGNEIAYPAPCPRSGKWRDNSTEPWNQSGRECSPWYPNQKQFGPKWKLEGEVARSLLNRDARQLSLESERGIGAFGLFTPNTSFEKHIAWKAAFNYKIHPRHQRFFTSIMDPGFPLIRRIVLPKRFWTHWIRTHHALAKQKILVNTDLGSEKIICAHLKETDSNDLGDLYGFNGRSFHSGYGRKLLKYSPDQ